MFGNRYRAIADLAAGTDHSAKASGYIKRWRSRQFRFAKA